MIQIFSEIFLRCESEPIKENVENINTTSEHFTDEIRSNVPKTVIKRKTRSMSSIKSNEKNQTQTDNEKLSPNSPQPKRKYKKRAVKEKEIFECEICHYKCSHQCMYEEIPLRMLYIQMKFTFYRSFAAS